MAMVLEHASEPASPQLALWVTPVVFAVLGLGLVGGVVMNVAVETTRAPNVVTAVQTPTNPISANTGNIVAPYAQITGDFSFSTCFGRGFIPLPAADCPVLN